MDHKFECLRCHQHLAASADQVGEEYTCPTCSAPLIVPDPIPSGPNQATAPKDSCASFSDQCPFITDPSAEAQSIESETGDQPYQEIDNLSSDEDLPLIRIERRFVETQLIACYADRILIGKKYFSALFPTSEMCDLEGCELLQRSLSKSEVIPLDRIKKIREFEPIYNKIGRHEFTRGIRTQFELQLPDGKNRRFSLRSCETGNIREFLFARTEAAYQLGQVKPRNPIIFAISFVAFVALVFGGVFGLIMSLIVNSSVIQFLISMAIVGLATLVGSKMLGVKYSWIYPSTDTPTQSPPRKRKRRKINRLGDRLSFSLGLMLKVLALIYWILVVPNVENVFFGNKPSRSLAFDTILYIPLVLLILYGSRLCQRQYEPKLKNDKRKPIVFLRPFEDDNRTTLQPIGGVSFNCGVRQQWRYLVTIGTEEFDGRLEKGDLVANSYPIRLLRILFNFGSDTSEESLVRQFEKVGPVIAIGRPAEFIPTSGASRIYLPDEDWQRVVSDELSNSQCVVLQPGLSKGVHWELAYIRNNCEACRILLCMISFWKHPDNFEKLNRMMRKTFRVELARNIPFLKNSAFVYFDSNWVPQTQELSFKCPILWPFVGDATDLSYTLEPFLQGRDGRAREQPRPPKWRNWAARCVTSTVAVVLCSAISIGFVIILNYVKIDLTHGRSEETKSDYFAGLLIASPRVELKGSAVPYRLKIPITLIPEPHQELAVEHLAQSTQKDFSLAVVATANPEDVSDLAATRLAIFKKQQAVEEAKIEQSRSLASAGTLWTESRILLNYKNGNQVREIAYAANFQAGFVLLVFTMNASPEAIEQYTQLTEEIFQSFKIIK